DVRVAGDRIVAVGPGLDRRAGEDVVEAIGRAVIPPLHDHHVHLRAMAAAHGSLDVGPAATADGGAFDARLRGAAADLPPGAWVRAVGSHEAVAGPPARHRLT